MQLAGVFGPILSMGLIRIWSSGIEPFAPGSIPTSLFVGKKVNPDSPIELTSRLYIFRFRPHPKLRYSDKPIWLRSHIFSTTTRTSAAAFPASEIEEFFLFAFHNRSDIHAKGLIPLADDFPLARLGGTSLRALLKHRNHG